MVSLGNVWLWSEHVQSGVGSVEALASEVNAEGLVFPGCGSRLSADLGKEFYPCFHFIILISIGIFALKSGNSDVWNIPPPTQP